MFSYEFDTDKGPLTIVAASMAEAYEFAREKVSVIYSCYCAGEVGISVGTLWNRLEK